MRCGGDPIAGCAGSCTRSTAAGAAARPPGGRAVAPLWRRSAGLLEREEERIGAAIDAGVSATVLAAEIAPRAKLVEDTLRFAASPAAPRRLGVDKRGLTVAPLIASSGAGTVATPGDFLVLISYPL